jgi:hypothetical protein
MQMAANNSTLDIENLTLDDEDEELEIEVGDERQQIEKQSFNLVGRFLTNKPIRVKMLMEKMGDIWQPGRGMDIEEPYPGLFVFKFFHPLDVQHILKQGPWAFDGHTLVLNTLSDDEDPREVSLFKVPFWIQVHNLPSGYMSEKVGKQVADYIGDFLEYDEKNDNLSWGKYMRIRVLVDVREPLKKAKKIKKQGGDSCMVQFKYERLGTFCYVCGLLGHSESRCPKLFDHPELEIKRAWSPELRAESGRRQGRESRWIRQGGNPNWVAPDPVFMRNKCASSNSGDNGTNHKEVVNANNEKKFEKANLADVFRKPSILFPKPLDTSTKKAINEEVMDEDEAHELIIEGDRKRSRKHNISAHVNSNDHIYEKHNNSDVAVEKNSNKNHHFLMAGPGGARQG